MLSLLTFITIIHLSNFPVSFESGIQAENWESSGDLYDIREWSLVVNV